MYCAGFRSREISDKKSKQYITCIKSSIAYGPVVVADLLPLLRDLHGAKAELGLHAQEFVFQTPTTNVVHYISLSEMHKSSIVLTIAIMKNGAAKSIHGTAWYRKSQVHGLKTKFFSIVP